MSTATDMRSGAQASSLASSAAFRTFAVVFAIAAPIIYDPAKMQNWPLFTYRREQPGRLAFSTRRTRCAMRSAMHFHYGWTANMLIGSAVLGVLATFLPERLTRAIPLSLTWIAAGGGDAGYDPTH